MSAVRTQGLGRRYGDRWALRDCSITIDPGRTVALVGPNGAGKTTLLQMLAGLTVPTVGVVSVFGEPPSQEPTGLARVGFVAQDARLYRGLSVADTLEMGRRLNPRWDAAIARAHVTRLGLRPQDRVGAVSGGQRAQLALALALAKRPDLLLLDEPLASLDPLSRRGFLQELMSAAAEREVTIVFSSHLIGDLERVCDHLIVVDRGRTLVAGAIEEIMSTHAIVTGPGGDAANLPGVTDVVRQERTPRHTVAVVRSEHPPFDPSWHAEPVGLEELILAYLEQTPDVAPRPLEVLR
jgi:ABC-2 type transport system ATP-binding protein